MQIDNAYSNINEPLLNPIDIMIHPRKQTVMYIKSQMDTEKEITGIKKQSSPDLEDNNDLIISTALRTTQNRMCTVLINNFLEQPYTLKTGS